MKVHDRGLDIPSVEGRDERLHLVAHMLSARHLWYFIAKICSSGIDEVYPPDARTNIDGKTCPSAVIGYVRGIRHKELCD